MLTRCPCMKTLLFSWCWRQNLVFPLVSTVHCHYHHSSYGWIPNHVAVSFVSSYHLPSSCVIVLKFLCSIRTQSCWMEIHHKVHIWLITWRIILWLFWKKVMFWGTRSLYFGLCLWKNNSTQIICIAKQAFSYFVE